MKRYRPNDSIPHYEPVELEGLDGIWICFFGGPFSNFVGGPFIITSRQPWLGHPYTANYRTIEHAFQASKAATKHDHELIRNAESPGEAKALGNSRASWVPGRAHIPLLRDDWEKGNPPTKYNIMLTGLRTKFANPHFQHYLLETDDYLIAEDSPTDAIWGIRSDDGFTGENLLGHALMQIRDEIRANSN